MTDNYSINMVQIHEDILVEIDLINKMIEKNKLSNIILNTLKYSYSVTFDKFIPERDYFDILDGNNRVHCADVRKQNIIERLLKIIHLRGNSGYISLYTTDKKGVLRESTIPSNYQALIENNVVLIRESERTGKVMIVTKKDIDDYLYEFLFPTYGRRKSKKGKILPVFNTRKEAMRYCFVQNEFN